MAPSRRRIVGRAHIVYILLICAGCMPAVKHIQGRSVLCQQCQRFVLQLRPPDCQRANYFQQQWQTDPLMLFPQFCAGQRQPRHCAIAHAGQYHSRNRHTYSAPENVQFDAMQKISFSFLCFPADFQRNASSVRSGVLLLSVQHRFRLRRLRYAFRHSRQKPILCPAIRFLSLKIQQIPKFSSRAASSGT